MILGLNACTSYRLDDPWPADIPDRQLFVDGYLQKRGLNSATEAQLSNHLKWIKRFYQGTPIYPNGWLNASERYLASMTAAEERAQVDRRLKSLGVQIANEWAQDNEIRLINSTNIATWASAMRTAAEQGEHLSFLDKVEKDVQALINQKITARDIVYENYFVEESFDDF